MMISVIVPVKDEKASLSELVSRTLEAGSVAGRTMEVILVDDGSRDGSWGEIERLARDNQCVSGVRLRRNFGKAAAVMAGVDAASGGLLLTLDADLQDDPAELSRMLEHLEKTDQDGRRLDLVCGWKKQRNDPWHKVFPSRVFNWMIGLLTGVNLHDHNTGLKLYRAEVFHEVRIYGELHRFVPVLAAARGFRVGEIPVTHHARKHGKSKYGFTRFFKGFLDLLTVSFLTGFGNRPKHLLGAIGLTSMVIGAVAFFWLVLVWVIRLQDQTFGEPLHRRPLLVISVGAMLFGVQMLSLGWVAELILAGQSRVNLPYAVATRVGKVKEDPSLVPPPMPR
ncbi:MAG: glycosyltransferase family 2 protein [Planctomycetota bacterium]|nr:glycosyltransferase family 2 protein [Planctomycetota bacterium]